ncbi:MAG: SAM-dependent methyltransferase, partial [Cyanobacteria bacterium J06632_3]
ISLQDYGKLATEIGFGDIKMADWSRQVEVFWQEVVRSALTLDSVVGIVQAGMETIRGTAAIALMTTGFNRGLIRYGILRGTK